MGAGTTKPVTPELVEGVSFSLLPHPDHPPLEIKRIDVRVAIKPDWLHLRWRIEGAGQIRVPPLAGKRRSDGLWQATCFELFANEVAGYCEFNFSPSERWAAYDFDAYRVGMRERPVPHDPVVNWRGGASGLAIFDADIPFATVPSFSTRMGISAIIEENGGTKSYWALAHPPGKPDFHHSACFAATLPAPQLP